MAYFLDLERFGQRTAAFDEAGRETTYAHLCAAGDALAAQINGRCLVFLMCSNTVASIASYVGFLRHDIVPVLINHATAPALLRRLEDTYHPRYLCYPKDKLSAEQLGKTVYELEQYALAATDYEQNYGLYDELGLLLTTSGSTGSPKLVRQSYRNIAANTESIIKYLEISGNDRAITTLPMHYTYGLSIINTHLAQGAMLILTDATLMEKSFWTMLKTCEATTFGGVPYTYEMLKKLQFAKMELPSLRYLTQAGGHLSEELSAEFAELGRSKGIKFIVMYGQTEATARMSYVPWERAGEKNGSIGIAIPGGRFWIADAEGNPVSAGETGELIYEGDNVTLGYAECCEDLCLGDENHGRLATGDMAKADKDGYYYIVGRKKRFLKLFGSRVNLDEVEHFLHHRGIECVCSGKDDHMVLYLTDQSKFQEAEHCIVNDLRLPRSGLELRHIGRIPRNESGKVQYSALPAE